MIISGSSKKGFWLLLSLAAVGMLGFHLHAIITTYLAYNTNVFVQVDLVYKYMYSECHLSKCSFCYFQLVSEYETDFPAVTICNLNPIKQSALSNAPDSVSNLFGDETSDRKRRRRSLGEASDVAGVLTSIQ